MTVVFDPAEQQSSTDPWPLYRKIRQEAPLHLSPRRGFWVVSRHVDCNSVLRDRRASADALNIDPDQMPVGFDSISAPVTPISEFENLQQSLSELEQDNRPFLFRDPPDHTRLRGLVAKAFTPRMVEGLRARTEVKVNELIDAALEKGDIDAMADFAYPLPVWVICEMLGVPMADEDRFKEWSHALSRGLDPDFLLTEEVRTQRFDAILSFAAYFFELLADRREHPGPDLLSQLAVAEESGDILTPGELLSTCILLLVAGHETTVNLIGGGLLALLQHPDQLEKWRADPTLDRTAIEELLRFVSPVQLTGRALLEDLPVTDGVLPKGSFAMLLIAAANRDPDAFERPEALDLARSDNRHLGFGFGIHHCLGSPLARMEAQVALPALLRRCRDIALLSPSVSYRENVVLRGLVDLPVHLTRRDRTGPRTGDVVRRTATRRGLVAHLVAGLAVAAAVAVACPGPTTAGAVADRSIDTTTFVPVHHATAGQVHRDAATIRARLIRLGYGSASVTVTRNGIVVRRSAGNVPPSVLQDATVNGVVTFRPVECFASLYTPSDGTGSRPVTADSIDGIASLWRGVPDHGRAGSVRAIHGTSERPGVRPYPDTGTATGTGTAAGVSDRGTVLLSGLPTATERYVLGPTAMTAAGVASARAARNQTGQWVVSYTTTRAGTALWNRVAQASFHRFLAITLDGVVVSAPIIQPTQRSFSSFGSGGQIAGNLTASQARQLALALDTGPLAVPLEIP